MKFKRHFINEEVQHAGKFGDSYVGAADIVPEFEKIRKEYFPDYTWKYGIDEDGTPKAYWDGRNGIWWYELTPSKQSQSNYKINFYIKILENKNNEYGVYSNYGKGGKSKQMDLSEFIDLIKEYKKAKATGKSVKEYNDDIDDWVEGAHQNESTQLKESFRNFRTGYMMECGGCACDDDNCICDANCEDDEEWECDGCGEICHGEGYYDEDTGKSYCSFECYEDSAANDAAFAADYYRDMERDRMWGEAKATLKKYGYSIIKECGCGNKKCKCTRKDLEKALAEHIWGGAKKSEISDLDVKDIVTWALKNGFDLHSNPDDIYQAYSAEYV